MRLFIEVAVTANWYNVFLLLRCIILPFVSFYSFLGIPSPPYPFVPLPLMPFLFLSFLKKRKRQRHLKAVIGIGETGSGEEMIVGGVAMMIIKVAGIIEEMIVIVAVGRIKKR